MFLTKGMLLSVLKRTVHIINIKIDRCKTKVIISLKTFYDAKDISNLIKLHDGMVTLFFLDTGKHALWQTAFIPATILSCQP